MDELFCREELPPYTHSVEVLDSISEGSGLRSSDSESELVGASFQERHVPWAVELDPARKLPSLSEVEEGWGNADDGRRKSLTTFRVEGEARDGAEEGKERLVKFDIRRQVHNFNAKI